MRVLLFAGAIVLAGCSSASKQTVNHTPQYCHTSQEILAKNGETVQSQTLVKCTDSQVERVASRRLGLSPHCGEFTYWMNLGGQNVQRKGISCQKPDGTWEIINTSEY